MLLQEARDREAQAAAEAKLLEKLARADIIAEQRSSIAEELQRMRKDIAQQEAWVKVYPSRPTSLIDKAICIISHGLEQGQHDVQSTPADCNHHHCYISLQSQCTS